LVFSPTPYTFDISISSLTPNNATIRAAVTASLTDILFQTAQPGGIVYYSQLIEAIMATQGVVHCLLSSPTADTQIPAGQLPVLGTITYPVS
jgi:uncharacterized phage protein gp47/JayE